MPYIRLTYCSEKLHGGTDLSVFYPSAPRPVSPSTFESRKLKASVDKTARYQVLWLIHGGGDDYTAWPLDAMIQRACDAKQIIVVMPTIRDLPGVFSGADYLGFVTEELPKFIGFLFPISGRREDNFIAGLSYGGYFAYRCALTHPDNYSCVGSFSSPLNVVEDVCRHHQGQGNFASVDEIVGTDRDLLFLSSELKKEGRSIPRMFQTCGTEDFTWDFNVVARDHFRSLGLDHTWIQRPGIHNFEFWDVALKQYLDWLPLRGRSFKEGN
jgi:putative tributyrin esterase